MKSNLKNIIEETLAKKKKLSKNTTKKVLKESYVGHDELMENVIKSFKSKYSKSIKENENTDPIDTVTMDVPLLVSLLNFAKESKKEDELGEIADNAVKLSKEKGMLSSEDFVEIVGNKQEGEEEELNEISINEKKKKDDEDDSDNDDHDDIDLDSDENYSDMPEEDDSMEPETDNPQTSTTGGKVDPNIKKTMDALTQAQASAKELGDQKLLNQLGNTITFFTKTHIVGLNQQQQ